MLNLNLTAAERFVDSYRANHQDFFWDGWTLVKFKMTPAGATHRRGLFRNGSWGIADRIEADRTGVFKFRV